MCRHEMSQFVRRNISQQVSGYGLCAGSHHHHHHHNKHPCDVEEFFLVKLPFLAHVVASLVHFTHKKFDFFFNMSWYFLHRGSLFVVCAMIVTSVCVCVCGFRNVREDFMSVLLRLNYGNKIWRAYSIVYMCNTDEVGSRSLSSNCFRVLRGGGGCVIYVRYVCVCVSEGSRTLKCTKFLRKCNLLECI